MPKKPPVFRLHDFEQTRPNSYRRGYTKRWNAASKRYRVDHPYCVVCFVAGRIRLATEVDHVIPHRNDPLLFWDQDNWQALCHRCHSEKTARGE